jgi:hypothetical protein
MENVPLVVAGMLGALLGVGREEDREADDRVAWCGVVLLAVLAGMASLTRG